MTLNWESMSPQARNLAYNNVEAVGAETARRKAEEWLAMSTPLRASSPMHLDLPYATGARTKWDLYPAADEQAPCLIHLHGGYWQRGSKETFACLASGLQSHGWAAALPGYTLAPEATLSQIIIELRMALDWLHANAADHGIRGPVILSGWSAGGLMTALFLDHPVVSAGLAVSGVFDLAHLRDSPHVNDKLKLTEEEVARLSPMRRPMAAKPLAIAYGSDELPAMIESSRSYYRRRSESHLPGGLVPIPAANHFTILDQFLDPDSHLVKTALMLAAY